MTAEPEGAAPTSTDPPHQDVEHPEIPYEPPAVAVAETITPPKRGWGPRATFLTVFSVVSVIYVATFVRGLAWQWQGILTAQPATAPVVANAPRGAISSSRQSAAPNSNPANAAPQPPRVAIARTDVPAPRNATDDRGVTYDADGVAVMGIDADPTGVYNVPAGRQLRIGGPTGQLFDVQEGGKLAPAKTPR
ncbi:MAG: hypothetical protein DWI50_02615 [Chloroflexi bacterium]|nr:MAG: hypothetical protein DWI50_02615 [Chloroflexota bacterium]